MSTIATVIGTQAAAGRLRMTVSAMSENGWRNRWRWKHDRVETRASPGP
jgi:hypothetical protein